VLDGDPVPPPVKGHSPQFSANVRRGQMAGWTKKPLGMKVSLGPGDFVLDGDPAPPLRMEVGLGPGDCVRWGPSSPRKKGTAPTQFLANVYCGQMAGWIKMPLGTQINLGPGTLC